MLSLVEQGCCWNILFSTAERKSSSLVPVLQDQPVLGMRHNPVGALLAAGLSAGQRAPELVSWAEL